MMYDFSFGGIYDERHSAAPSSRHILRSMERVYGGFFLAAALGIPLGLMIGRSSLRASARPTIPLLRRSP